MVALSFDTEEFDVPREHGVQWDTLKEGMEVSTYGTNRILDCLKECGVKGTFFCTSNFAQNAPDVIKRIIDEGHEVAAHGCDHWNPQPTDLTRSKQILESQTGLTVKGYRQPRMFPLDLAELKRNGYIYNASLNPCFSQQCGCGHEELGAGYGCDALHPLVPAADRGHRRETRCLHRVCRSAGERRD